MTHADGNVKPFDTKCQCQTGGRVGLRAPPGDVNGRPRLDGRAETRSAGHAVHPARSARGGAPVAHAQGKKQEKSNFPFAQVAPGPRNELLTHQPMSCDTQHTNTVSVTDCIHGIAPDRPNRHQNGGAGADAPERIQSVSMAPFRQGEQPSASRAGTLRAVRQQRAASATFTPAKCARLSVETPTASELGIDCRFFCRFICFNLAGLAGGAPLILGAFHSVRYPEGGRVTSRRRPRFCFVQLLSGRPQGRGKDTCGTRRNPACDEFSGDAAPILAPKRASFPPFLGNFRVWGAATGADRFGRAKNSRLAEAKAGRATDFGTIPSGATHKPNSANIPMTVTADSTLAPVQKPQSKRVVNVINANQLPTGASTVTPPMTMTQM
ncbi:hypothetical protein HUJ05_011099 [Dendroctonus ponderosae]|nr:hypothetical protein HUJ05_011099 [Dendroctonus ponderosae]